MNLSRASRSLGAVCAVLLSGSLIAAQAAPIDHSPEFRAGPRDTVAIERSVRDEPRAQFAALAIDSADLNGAEAEVAKPRASAFRRVGPRGTIRRAR
jgi:hypothetical protein